MEHPIASLNLPKTAVTQLKEMGYNNLSDIEPNKIRNKLGIELNVSLQKAPKTKTALEIYNEELLNGCLMSYNENLDSVLKDVIVPETISEVSGEPGSGKTQVCFLLCICVQLPKWCGGIEGKAFYIDTNSNFGSHRITELAEDFIKRYNSIKPSDHLPSTKFDKLSILQNIYYCKVCDVTELMACIKHLQNSISDKNVRLIIIDSFSFIARMVDVKTRKTFIANLLHDLRTLAEMHNSVVIITNDLTTRVNKGESYATPSFGDSFYHLVNSRILLSKKNQHFHAKLEKNIVHGQKETYFYL